MSQSARSLAPHSLHHLAWQLHEVVLSLVLLEHVEGAIVIEHAGHRWYKLLRREVFQTVQRFGGHILNRLVGTGCSWKVIGILRSTRTRDVEA